MRRLLCDVQVLEATLPDALGRSVTRSAVVRQGLMEVERAQEDIRRIRDILGESAPSDVSGSLRELGVRLDALVDPGALPPHCLKRVYDAMTEEWTEWRRDLLRDVVAGLLSRAESGDASESRDAN